MSRKSRSYFITAGFLLVALGLGVLIIPQSGKENTDYFLRIENNLGKEIANNQNSTKLLLEKIKATSIVELDLSSELFSYPVFIYKNGALVSWSDNTFVPGYSEIEGTDSLAYYEKSGWKGLIKKVELAPGTDSETIFLATLIPLQYNPTISNKYLRSKWNENVFQSSQFFISGINEENYRTLRYQGIPLFSIQLSENYKPEISGTKYLALYFTLTGIILLIIVSATGIRELIDKRNSALAILWFILLWICVFAIFKITGSQNLWEGVPLLDSRVYASSWLLSNLLDLILFSSFLLSASILLVRLINRWSYIRWMLNVPTTLRYFLATFFVLLLLYTLTMHFLVFRDIYDNSQVSLDVNHSLSFTWERVACLIVFLLNAFSVYFLFHLFLKSWILSVSADIKSLIITLASGLIVYIIVQNRFPFLFIISCLVLYLILLGSSRVYLNFARLNYLSLLYLAGSLILSSVLSAYSVTQLEQKRDFEDILQFGNDQLLDADIFGEFLMDETIRNVKEDPFIGNWMSSPFVSKDIISRKITQKYIDSYLDRYEVQIYLYNQNGRPLSTNANALNFYTVKDRVAVNGNDTDFENIFRARDFQSDMFKEYYAFIEVERLDSRVGYILIDFKQKRVIPNNVYPELLVDSRIDQPPGDLDVSYAVFSGQSLLNNVGDFNYQNDFPVDELNFEKIYSKGSHIKGNFHVALDAGQRTLVISSHSHSFGEALSNFSFLFLSLTILVGLTFTIFIFTQPENSPMRGFASKIQLYLNLAFILPLMLVSISTLSILSTQSRNEIVEQYRQKGNELAQNVQRELDNFQFEPTQGRDRLAEKLRTTAAILKTDADLYNLSGGQIVSTQPKIYENGLISKYIDPRAKQAIVSKSANYITSETRVGDLSYNVTYIPVKTLNTGRLIGILGLPFFDFKYILEAQLIGVLTNILNIFSLLFLTLLIISYFASQRLVVPLKMIAEKLTRTSLTGYNPPIDWHTQDEIGLLVGEYNRMIRNLEASKEVLTRTQKELAWREIAKQVAHEIKNPLTPMKLTLQQLQRRISGTTSLETNDVEKPVNTLLHQVDVLKDIATSFSAFAKMPIPEMKKFNIVELLRKTFILHKNINNTVIEFSPEEESIFVMGDVKLMGRITTNIILNAIQSSSGDNVHIHGKILVTGRKALVSIKDNGPGIDEQIQDKVFLPSFSTKKEGSGIGLAIAKHGIEQSGGQIWFETAKGKGTTFFIELPLAEE